ncbi:flagellar basal body P-ring protein FlgI [Pyruvatibacter mobilis]|jgi:flagellar P-ring protein precursor FlgI|uniref:Flagellar P-ring protein n=1 Tax=Pyruvatibacter mobilis TaxID=1712261 RepID=A0A845QDH3_9HYPH|nr:flagellar basal body P-ring protein FlgI [Pyruvatibacter mobilis]NBG96474.1 flagellar basal body P-ring protein FlgI [Pyruvatibacter mobilis]QJD74631.1 flagellar basal body P-ring protein FlgI [Pyruvatibacter mobilis]GGD08837.1 flagellar P-ring protein 1 [Pyruvatibacter mobilis]
MLFADLKIFRPALLAVPAALVAASLAAVFLLAGPAQASSRIKDLASVEGIRENHLVGYGLVVGLDGTGDSLRNAPFTRQSLQAMLERLGVNTRDANLNTDNVAAVMVTGNLPAFGAQGSRMDISVATLGDATSLLGGTLLVTPLMGADGEVYAVAQGPVAVAGFSAEGDGASVKRGVATSGRIPNGAIIEREIAFALDDLSTVRLSLHNPDLTTAQRMANVINTFIGGDTATATDPSTVALSIPRNGKNAVVSMLTEIEQLRVSPDSPAKVVIDEASGVIVMGKDVRVSTVAIAQGNLTIRVTETPQVSQPNPFAEQGQTAIVPRTNIDVDDDAENRLGLLREGVTLESLVDGLNALGVGPRDMISILQTIRAAGALQAELEVL